MLGNYERVGSKVINRDGFPRTVYKEIRMPSHNVQKEAVAQTFIHSIYDNKKIAYIFLKTMHQFILSPVLTVQNYPIAIFRGLGEDDSGKNLKQIIS
jgi:hypothetical protein